MKQLFSLGDKKTHTFIVKGADVAAFQGKTVHDVCSTFALGREIEWSTRLFVLDMLEADEEGVGTQLMINHKAPAFVDEEVVIEAEVVSFDNNELTCNYAAKVGGRVIAEGLTGQKILKKDKIKQIFSRFR